MVDEEKYNQEVNKVKNQANELNHLTNEVIPVLKKENKELKKLKNELTEALDNSTKKYYDQLDINAELSETFTKNGAELALIKVKYQNLEKENKKLNDKLSDYLKKESEEEKEDKAKVDLERLKEEDMEIGAISEKIKRGKQENIQRIKIS